MILQLFSMVLFILYLALFPFLSWILPSSRSRSEVLPPSRNISGVLPPSRSLSGNLPHNQQVATPSLSYYPHPKHSNTHAPFQTSNLGLMTRMNVQDPFESGSLPQYTHNSTKDQLRKQRLGIEKTRSINDSMYEFLEHMPGDYFEALPRNNATISDARERFTTYILPLVQDTGDLQKDIQMTIERENKTPFGLGWFSPMNTDTIDDLLNHIEQYERFTNGRWDPHNHITILHQRIEQKLPSEIAKAKQQYPWYTGLVNTDYDTYEKFQNLAQADRFRQSQLLTIQQTLDGLPNDIQGDFKVGEAQLKKADLHIRQMFSTRYLPINNGSSSVLDDIQTAIQEEATLPYGLACFGNLTNVTDLVERINQYIHFTKQKTWIYEKHVEIMQRTMHKYSEMFIRVKDVEGVQSIPQNANSIEDSIRYYERLRRNQSLIIQHIIAMELITLLVQGDFDLNYSGICYNSTPELSYYCKQLEKHIHNQKLLENLVSTAYHAHYGFRALLPGDHIRVWFSKSILNPPVGDWKTFQNEFHARFDRLFENPNDVRTNLTAIFEQFKENPNMFDNKPRLGYTFVCRTDRDKTKHWIEAEKILYQDTLTQ